MSKYYSENDKSRVTRRYSSSLRKIKKSSSTKKLSTPKKSSARKIQSLKKNLSKISLKEKRYLNIKQQVASERLIQEILKKTNNPYISKIQVRPLLSNLPEDLILNILMYLPNYTNFMIILNRCLIKIKELKTYLSKEIFYLGLPKDDELNEALNTISKNLEIIEISKKNKSTFDNKIIKILNIIGNYSRRYYQNFNNTLEIDIIDEFKKIISILDEKSYVTDDFIDKSNDILLFDDNSIANLYDELIKEYKKINKIK